MAVSVTINKGSGAFDDRIIRVGIEIGNDTFFFQDEDIRISGEKFGSAMMNQCTVQISNLTRDHRNLLLSRASPVVLKDGARTPARVTVDVGRKSYGLFRLFEGQVFTSTVMPPPDIGIVLRSLTNNLAGALIAVNSHAGTATLRSIAKTIADQNGLELEFKAEDRNIGSYAFTGAARQQIQKLQMMGDVNAFVDNGKLVVLGKNEDRGSDKFIINMQNGMVGVPQATESGVNVQVMLTPKLQIGSGVAIRSEINPSVNGENYNIRRMEFHAANRDYPFFYNLTCVNTLLNHGTTQ